MTVPKATLPRHAPKITVPFFRPSIGEAEIAEVVDTLRSGHLTTGPKVARFESEFAEFLGVEHAVALNSATAALHLALEAVGVGPGDVVIVPTMTFAATAEIVRHLGATPVFVDCEAVTLGMDIDALAHTLRALKAQVSVAGLRPPFGPVKAIITMHHGGQMVDAERVRWLARDAGVPVVEDATHALPAMYRSGPDAPWQSVGRTADITCFSFYANKSITTGEGGMAVTQNEEWADRIRLMSWHGVSKVGTRFTHRASWNYQVVEAGFKFNMPDIAASLGIHQLRKANDMWHARRAVAEKYIAALAPANMFVLPQELPDRKHAWHLFCVRLRPELWRITREDFIDKLTARGIGTSVHWMPLHMHPYYIDTYGYRASDFPAAERLWPHLVSLPIYPDMTTDEQNWVIESISEIADESRS